MEDHISADVLAVARALVASGLTARCAGEPEESAECPPYTVPEAAEQLKVHESTLYRAIQDGYLRAFSVGSGGRAIRIPVGELEAFKARRMIRRPRHGPHRSAARVPVDAVAEHERATAAALAPLHVERTDMGGVA